jgi:hypothetical protein
MFSFFKKTSPKSPTKTEGSRNSEIIEFVTSSLTLQTTLMRNEKDELGPRAKDQWSWGYVAGFTDATLQKNCVGIDENGMAIMTVVFGVIFGLEDGPRFFGDFMRLQGADQNLDQGMLAGGRDLFNWLNAEKGNPAPSSWLDHYHAPD